MTTNELPALQAPITTEVLISTESAARELPASVEIEVQRAIAEVKASVTAAKMDPRNEDAARRAILAAFQRPALALMGLWVVPRGSSEVSGPSIRAAEEMARLWGNLDYGTIEHGKMGGQSQQETYCWDKQSNTKKTVRFSVDHVRYTRKGGNIPLTNPQEISEVVAASSQKKVRDCILALLPRDLTAAAVDVMKATRARITTDVGAALSLAVKAFAEDFAVTQEQIEQMIGCPLAKMGAEELETLRSVFTTLSEDGAKVSDFFGEVKPLQQQALNVERTETGELKAALPKVEEPPKPDPKTPGSKKKGIKSTNQPIASTANTGPQEETPDAATSVEPEPVEPTAGLPSAHDIFE
jgi:hypothetical protein